MIKILKLAIMLLGIAVIFGAGYLMGSQRLEELSRLLLTVRSEMSQKTSGLEQEVQYLRTRIRLFTARQHLVSAQTAVTERNYGVVQNELEKVRGDLNTVKRLSDPKTREALSRLDGPLKTLITSADNPNPALKEQIDSFREKLDGIME